jgi:pentapeptide MXKDX repeat protein
MTKRSRIGLLLLAASVGLGLALAPAAFAEDMKKDNMSSGKMQKTDGMTKKNTMTKDTMSKDDMKKDGMKK